MWNSIYEQQKKLLFLLLHLHLSTRFPFKRPVLDSSHSYHLICLLMHFTVKIPVFSVNILNRTSNCESSAESRAHAFSCIATQNACAGESWPALSFVWGHVGKQVKKKKKNFNEFYNGVLTSGRLNALLENAHHSPDLHKKRKNPFLER